VYDVHPPSARWTHLALQVGDIDATIDWYTKHTPLELLTRREDEMGYGAWLGHADAAEHPFVLVLSQFFEETDPYADQPRTVLGPFAHIGIELTSRDEVDRAADEAEKSGSLKMPPTQMPPPIGYIAMVSDPDGNVIEFSFDQGVYALARDQMTGGEAT
jgi:lactoylglutathione lyase